MEYPFSGWHPYTLGTIEKLVMAQPRAARFALGSHNNISNVSKRMLEQLGRVSMQMKQQAKSLGVCMLYKIHNGLANLGKSRPDAPPRETNKTRKLRGIQDTILTIQATIKFHSFREPSANA